MRRPRAARWRRTLFRWPTFPSTRHQRAPFARRCRSLRQGGPQNPRNTPYVRTSTTHAGRFLEHLAWHAVQAAGGGLRHPPGLDTEIPVACPVRPAPLPSGGRPRGGPVGGRGGIGRGPGGGRCSPSGFHPRETGPPVNPPGSGLPTPHGPGTPRIPGCPSGPRSDASTGQLTPGGCGGRCPLAPLLEPAKWPRPTRRCPYQSGKVRLHQFAQSWCAASASVCRSGHEGTAYLQCVDRKSTG